MNSNVVGHPALIEATLLRRLEALTQRDKELRVENQDLRRRREVAHGQPRGGTWRVVDSPQV